MVSSARYLPTSPRDAQLKKAIAPLSCKSNPICAERNATSRKSTLKPCTKTTASRSSDEYRFGLALDGQQAQPVVGERDGALPPRRTDRAHLVGLRNQHRADAMRVTVVATGLTRPFEAAPGGRMQGHAAGSLMRGSGEGAGCARGPAPAPEPAAQQYSGRRSGAFRPGIARAVGAALARVQHRALKGLTCNWRKNDA